MLYYHKLYKIDVNLSYIISLGRGISEMPEEEWHMSCFVADLHVTVLSRDRHGQSSAFPLRPQLTITP